MMQRWMVLWVALAGACESDPSEARGDAGKPAPDARADTAVDTGTDADADFLATELLSRPTATSVAVSVVPNKNLELFFEYGISTGAYTEQTATAVVPAKEPLVTSIEGLEVATRYFYRARWRTPGESTFAAGAERTFHTARQKGQPFVFTIQADPHLDDKSNLELYQQTLTNELADAPDFMIDLGDTFMCEKHSTALTATAQTARDDATVEARYLFERGNFGLIAHSAPLFLVNGNHDGESGWMFNGTSDNLAVWATLARKAYFPAPIPDGFYTGASADEPFVGKRGSWYAWEWGDALFVVLDPYWYTSSKVKSDGWVLTLGQEQYR
jgi:hypothetical protein